MAGGWKVEEGPWEDDVEKGKRGQTNSLPSIRGEQR
jgi:hypothetical protein